MALHAGLYERIGPKNLFSIKNITTFLKKEYSNNANLLTAGLCYRLI